MSREIFFIYIKDCRMWTRRIGTQSNKTTARNMVLKITFSSWEIYMWARVYFIFFSFSTFFPHILSNIIYYPTPKKKDEKKNITCRYSKRISQLAIMKKKEKEKCLTHKVYIAIVTCVCKHKNNEIHPKLRFHI